MKLAQDRYDQATQPLDGQVVVPTGVADVVPAVHRLAQNFPNPFTTSTQIGYAVPEGAHATIRVYDAAGRMVTTLLNGTSSSGSILWNGTDSSGRRVSTGIYFYRLRAGDVTETRKMLLLE